MGRRVDLGRGRANGYTVNPDGTMSNPTYGVLYDGSHWTARTRYDIEVGTLYIHRPANPNQIVASSGFDSIEFGIGIDINDLQFQTAANGRDLIIGIDGGGELVQSFASLSDQIAQLPNGSATRRRAARSRPSPSSIPARSTSPVPISRAGPTAATR